jgi:hypothetical protein
MPSDLAQPVGNTSEASASMGGSGRLYSPFSPFYNPARARKIAKADFRKRVRTNPPLTTEQEAAILAYQTPDAKVVIPTYAALAVAGLIVNREWSSAAILCRKLASFARSRSKGDTAGVTFVNVYEKLAEYVDCLVAGQAPVRSAATKGERTKYKGRPIPLWDDVARCALAEDGNVKLPFAAYSEMPVVTCPGAGGVAAKFAQLGGSALGAANASQGVDINGCASFCYSLKALRNPTVCYRLYTLTLGMSVDPTLHVATVVDRMLKLNAKKGVKIMRLFVDGDFRSAAAIETWMEGVRALGAKGITVYGYSKSWPEFLSVHEKNGASYWPTNYVLNISSGSRYYRDPAMLAKMRALPIARGEYIAIDPMERLLWKAMTKVRGEKVWAAYTKRVAAVANSSMSAGRKASAVEALRSRLGALITHANPDLAASYNDYVATVHDLESKGSRTLERVRNAIGEPTMVPGPIVQASTYAFLTAVKGPGEVPCPIACGSCPNTAIPQHEKVIAAARLDDTKLLEEMHVAERMKELDKQRAGKGGNVHLCGNARAKLNIIIGVH